MAENFISAMLVRILPDMTGFATEVKAGVHASVASFDEIVAESKAIGTASGSALSTSMAGAVAAAAPIVAAEAGTVGETAGASLSAGVVTSFEAGMAAFAAQAGATFGPIIAEAEVASATLATRLGTGLSALGASATGAAAVVNRSVGTASGALEHLGVSAGMLKVIGGAALAAFAIKGAEHFGQLGLAVEKFHTVAGISEEDASRFIAVADKYGVGSDQMSRAVGFLGKVLGGNADALKAYGVAVARSAAGNVDLSKTTFNVIDAYNKMEDPAEKAKLATVAFGRSYQGLIPLIDVGSKKIIEDFESVNAAEIFNEKKVEEAKEFRAQMAEMHKSFEALSLNIGRAVIPALEVFGKTTALGVSEMAKFDSATNGVAGKALSLTAVTAAGALAFSGLVGIGGKVVDVFGRMKLAMVETEGGLTAVGTTAVGATAGLAALAAIFIAQNWLNNATKDVKSVDDALKQLIIDLHNVGAAGGADEARGQLEALSTAADKLQKAATGDFWHRLLGKGGQSDTFLTDQEKHLKYFQEAVDKILKTDPAAAEGIVTALMDMKGQADAGDQATRQYLDSLGLTNRAITDLVKNLELGIEAQKALNEEQGNGQSAAEKAAENMTEEAKAQELMAKVASAFRVEQVKAGVAATEATKAAAEALKTSQEAALAEVQKLTSALQDQAVAALGLNDAHLATENADLRVEEAVKKYHETLTGIPPSLAEIQSAQEALTQATEAYNKTTAVTVTSDLDKEKALIKLQEAQQKLADITVGASRAEKEAARDSTATALQKYLDVMKDATATTLDRQKALTDLHSAQEKQTDVEGKGKNADLERRKAVVDVTEAQAAYDEALRGTTGSAEDQAAALKNMEEAQKHLADVSKGTIATEGEKRHAYLDLEAAINGAAAAHEIEAKQTAVSKGAHYDVRDSILAEISSLSAMKDDLNGPVKQAIGDHIDQLQRQLDLYLAQKAALTPPTAPYYGPRVDSANLPNFDMGGIVPGPVGKPVLAIVHGGERWTPPGQDSEMVTSAASAIAGQQYLKGASPAPTGPSPMMSLVPTADQGSPWPEQMTVVIEGTPFTAIIQRENANLAASIRAGRR